MSNVEKFRFVTYESDPDYVYLDNPSPNMITKTKEWFQDELGEENVEIYSLGFLFDGFCNSFKYPIKLDKIVAEKIYPNLVKDGKYCYRVDSMAEANQI